MIDTINAVGFFGMIIGGIILQVFLSKKQNKFLGLILPGISLLFSLIMVLGVPMYTTSTTETTNTEVMNGSTVETVEVSESTSEMIQPLGDTIVTMVFLFLLGNIPTVILLGIYWACREKLRKNKEIEKMNIQDLK